MNIQQLKKLVRKVWNIFSSALGPAEIRDLEEYEKVKKDFRPVNRLKRKLKATVESRDISAI